MDPNTFPTKGNLILAKNSLALGRQGFDLMDKKRNILIRELMELIDQASDIQKEIDQTFREAYQALQKANIQMGIHEVEAFSETVSIEESIQITEQSAREECYAALWVRRSPAWSTKREIGSRPLSFPAHGCPWMKRKKSLSV